MAVSDIVDSVVDGHLRLESFQIGQFVALVRGTGYRLAMFKPGVTGV